MTAAILELMGRKDHPVQVLNQAKGEIKHQYLSTEKAAKLLDWHPRHSLEAGLKETIAWYQPFLM